MPIKYHLLVGSYFKNAFFFDCPTLMRNDVDTNLSFVARGVD